MYKTSYIKRSANDQKVEKMVPVLEWNSSVKNAGKLSPK